MVTDSYDKPETKIVITKPENRERLIREWAASGEICRVLGHRWVHGAYGPHHKHKSGETTRFCPICNRTETKKEVWE